MQLQPLGDRALIVHLGDSIDEVTHRRVRAVCARLDEHPPRGMIEYVPAYASITLHYEPLALEEPGAGAGTDSPYTRFASIVRAALANVAEATTQAERLVEIPVYYGGEHGPDIEEVARQHELLPSEVARLHAEGEYRVYMLGFAPGFAYLGGLPQRIATPRRQVPRTNVPAGSVGIGGNQTGVYAIASPGGWQLIGRTPLRLFDAKRTPPALLAVGDRVRFRAIAPDEYARAQQP
jgi:inhibitor of KinA